MKHRLVKKLKRENKKLKAEIKKLKKQKYLCSNPLATLIDEMPRVSAEDIERHYKTRKYPF